MAVAHDTETRFATGAAAQDITAGDRTFTHTPVGTPKGVALQLVSHGSTSAVVTGVLYGGVAMALSASATNTSENGRVEVYTLVSGIPTGPQTVTLQGCTTTGKFCTCSTVTATGDTEVDATGAVNTTTSTDPQVSVVTSKETLTYGGL